MSPYNHKFGEIRFSNREECQTYLDKHNIDALPWSQFLSGRRDHYIAIFFGPGGVFGISSPTTAELIPEW